MISPLPANDTTQPLGDYVIADVDADLAPSAVQLWRGVDASENETALEYVEQRKASL